LPGTFFQPVEGPALAARTEYKVQEGHDSHEWVKERGVPEEKIGDFPHFGVKDGKRPCREAAHGYMKRLGGGRLASPEQGEGGNREEGEERGAKDLKSGGRDLRRTG